MDTIIDVPTHVERLHFRYNAQRNSDKNAAPWLFTFYKPGEVIENVHVEDYSIYGKWHTSPIEMQGRSTMAIACDACRLSLKDGKLTIDTTDTEQVDPSMNHHRLVLTRLNTEWLKDRSLPPFRVVEFNEHNEGVERLTFSVRGAGRSFSREWNVPNVGLKMHVGCFGHVTWSSDGKEASVWSRY